MSDELEVWPDDFLPMGKPHESVPIAIIALDKYKEMQATIDTLRQQLEQLTAELAAVEAERDAVIDKLDRLEATIDQLPGVKDEIYKLLEEWNDEEKDRWLYGSEGL